MSLAHKVGSDVERAYARSDLLEKRRALMERWSGYMWLVLIGRVDQVWLTAQADVFD